MLPFLDGAASVVDLGSGGGFPGLVLKLALPRLALTLVEARAREKRRFWSTWPPASG